MKRTWSTYGMAFGLVMGCVACSDQGGADTPSLDASHPDTGPRTADAGRSAEMDAHMATTSDSGSGELRDARPHALDADAADMGEVVEDAGRDAGELVIPPCPTFLDGVSGGVPEARAIVEASGIAASRRNTGVLYTHNDSGGGNKVFALTPSGRALAQISLRGESSSNDSEDIAVGPGPAPSVTYIYLGVIGGSDSSTVQARILRFAEPDIAADLAEPLDLTVDVDTLTYTYPDGPHDAEALFLDPATHELFVIAKATSAGVYRVGRDFADGARVTAERVATMTGAGTVNAADLSPDGRELIARSELVARLWRRLPGEAWATTLGRPSCELPVASEPNGEAIGFALDMSGYYTISEGTRPPMYFFARR